MAIFWKHSFVYCLLFLLIFSGCGASSQEESSTKDSPQTITKTDGDGQTGGDDPLSPNVDCGDFLFNSTSIDIGGDLDNGYEASGIDWHERLNMLFLVSDGGIVSTMNKDGTGLVNWSVAGDLEAITIADPQSDFVYVGVENPDGIIEFNISTGQITRQFDLTPWLQGAANQGLEALTFVPDEKNTEGGLFYAGHQGEGAIYVFQLPIRSSSGASVVTFIESIIPVAGRTDISDMDFDMGRNEIDVIYDTDNKLVSIQTDGTLIKEWDLPHDDQEGFARDSSCNIYIAQDTGKKVWFYSNELP